MRTILECTLRAGLSIKALPTAPLMNVYSGGGIIEVTIAVHLVTYLRILVVYTPQCTRVQKELIQSTSVHPIGISRYWGFLRQHNIFRRRRINGKHSPIHKPPIPQIWIVNFFCCPFENLVHEFLCSVRVGLVDEEFYGRCEQCQLNLPDILEDQGIARENPYFYALF